MSKSTLIPCLSVLLALAAPVRASGPSEEELRKQQIEYAKKLFAEGTQAMMDGEYKTALEKFQVAYRYAPDKHVFNFNIGMAALLAGDCNYAKASFEYFLTTVKKHPERKTAKQKLAEIAASGCAEEAAPEPEEEEEEDAFEAAPRGSLKDRELEADERRRRQTVYDALEELRTSAALYRRLVKKHGRKRPFPAVARYKERKQEKLVELLKELGWDVPAPEVVTVELPDDIRAACDEAVEREQEAAKEYEKIAEEFDDLDIYRMFTRLERRASGRHTRVFQRCPGA
jgi:tetratricopeptide (TPR) repeat protein